MNTLSKLPSQRRLYRAFLSHAHADKNFVNELHKWLSEDAGIPIWYDSYSLATSSTISTDIANAITQCRTMIIVLSKASIKSGWVEEEYNAAIGQRAKYKQYRIIPIRIEDCEIPGFLQTTKWIDISNNKSTEYLY
jgi:TIR domain